VCVCVGLWLITLEAHGLIVIYHHFVVWGIIYSPYDLAGVPFPNPVIAFVGSPEKIRKQRARDVDVRATRGHSSNSRREGQACMFESKFFSEQVVTS